MVFLDYCIFSAGVQYEFRNLQISVSEATHNKNGVFARGVVLYDDTVLMDLHLLKYFNLLNYFSRRFYSNQVFMQSLQNYNTTL